MKQISGNIHYTELVNHLDIDAEDCILIASDITKLALQARKNKQKFTVDEFIASFQQKLVKGTILIPAFTDNIKDGGTFDYKKDKPTTGALSNKIRRNKSFNRTQDPIHSFYVWGKFQDELINLSVENTFGVNSVFDFLHQKKGKMIFIDVDLQNSFTFVHHVEKCLNVPYRKDYLLNINYIDSRGDKKPAVAVFHTKKRGVFTHLAPLQNAFITNGVLSQLNYGGICVRQLEFDRAFDEVKNWLESGNKLHGFSLKLFFKQLIKLIMGYKKPID